MIFLVPISGSSMLPTLKNGDYILALKTPKSFYKKNDIIVVDHPEFGRIIKRISSIDNNYNILLKGDGTDTLSSERMGLINIRQVIGKMVWHIPDKKTP